MVFLLMMSDLGRGAITCCLKAIGFHVSDGQILWSSGVTDTQFPFKH